MARDMDIQVGISGFKQGTNIRDIRVPSILRQRRFTGLKWYDDAMGGQGHVPTTVHMLTGSPGAGKSTMIRQLADAITGSGHMCLMNTGEESLYQVALASERLNLKHGYVAGQETMLPDLLTYADNVIAAHRGKQVFLLQDSLQTLNDGKYKDGGTTGNTPVRVAQGLVSWAKQSTGIVVVVGQVTKGGDFAGKNTIKHAVDSHTKLYFDDDKKSDTWGERILECDKNRWGCSGVSYIVGMGETGLYQKGFFTKGVLS